MTAHPSDTGQPDPGSVPAQPVVYFGAWRNPGHHWFLPGMSRAAAGAALTPWGNGIDAAPTWNRRHGAQGQATVRHRDGWTALAVADYTVDHRPGSHATFAVHGVHEFDQALAAARAAFGEVLERIGPVQYIPGAD